MLPEWFHQLGLMAWPLALCSVMALALCLERARFGIQSQRNKQQHYDALAEYLQAHRSQPKAVRDEMVGIMLSELQRPYYRGIKALRMIGTVSPMLGLLGTILGVIAAFKVISAHAGPVSPSLIADGLWEAMLTTAVGLVIALPALVMAHMFQHISERQLHDICLQLNKLSVSFEMEPQRTAAPLTTSQKVSRLAA